MNPEAVMLERTPFYGGLSTETIRHLTSNAQLVTVKARDYFFHEADTADAMYLLTEGKVAITRRFEGKEYILAFLHAGDCFGEMALMDFRDRSASVRAETDSQALKITPGLLYELYKSDAEQFTLIQMNLGREISRRLRDADQTTFEQAILTQRFVTGEFSINAI